MMKTKFTTYGSVVALMTALLFAMAPAQASEFDGLYAGINVGANNSTATSLSDKSSTYLGLTGGYNWSIKKYLVGVNGFYDAHDASYTKEDAGGDVMLALPMDSWLPYLKLGVASTTPGERLNGGLGLKFKFADKWAVNGEWKLDSIKKDGVSYNNNNFVVGLNYYYDGGKKWVVDADAAARDAAAAREAMARNAMAKEAAAKEAATRESMRTALIEKPVRLEGASFGSGSSELLAAASAPLDEVVNAAKQFPEMNLEVVGYTDNVGKPQSNITLSQNRADAVKAYLVSKGVAADRIAAQGLGAENPIADNTTAEGRAKNRRVEVRYAIKETVKVPTTK